MSGWEKAAWAAGVLTMLLAGEVCVLAWLADAYASAPSETAGALVAGIVSLPMMVVGGWLGGQVADGIREALTEEDER